MSSYKEGRSLQALWEVPAGMQDSLLGELGWVRIGVPAAIPKRCPSHQLYASFPPNSVLVRTSAANPGRINAQALQT
jgi:hypothetical protein